MQGQEYIEPVIDLDTGYAFFDGLLIRSSSFRHLDIDSPCPVMAEEQVFLCRQMSKSLLELRDRENRGLSILDVGTGSGVLGIYAERLLNRNSKEFSTVYALDYSEAALNTALINAKNNNCQSIEFLEKQKYTNNSVSAASQDVILMNPPFNPTYTKLIEKIPHCGSADDYCLEVFREWINIAVNHLRPNGLIVGCQMSPVRDGVVVAVEEITKALGDGCTVRYLDINDGWYETKTFLEKQYHNYAKLIPKDEHKKLDRWIEKFSSKYQKLSFVYFEASKTRDYERVLMKVDDNLKQYDFSWERRIFFQSLSLQRHIKNLDSSLARINLPKAEDIIKTSKNPQICRDTLSKTVIEPLVEHLRYKLNSQYNINSVKYLANYLTGSFFCELVLFSPNRINSDQELFSFSWILGESDLCEKEAQDFFNVYHTLLRARYYQKATIFFAPSFFRSKRSDKWLSHLSDSTKNMPSVESRKKYLITYSTEVEKYKESEGYEYDKLSDYQTSVKIPLTFELEGAIGKCYFCSDSSYINKRLNLEKQEKDVPEMHNQVHSALHKQLGFKNETFMVSIPIYTKETESERYIVAGAFVLFGQLSDEVLSITTKDCIWNMLKNLALELKNDLTPVIAGYAYHRSGNNGLIKAQDKISHEIQGFLHFIRPDFPLELTMIIKDILYLQFSTEKSNEDRKNENDYNLKSCFNKPINFLINYLLDASILFIMGRDKINISKMSRDQIMEKINREKDNFMSIINIFYSPDSLESAFIVNDPDSNFDVNVKLILSVFTNTLSQVSIRRNQRITILVKEDRIRVINNYNPSRRKGTGLSYRIMQDLFSILERASKDALQEIKFNPIIENNLNEFSSQEKTFWSFYFQETDKLTSSCKNLWITEIPVSLIAKITNQAEDLK